MSVLHGPNRRELIGAAVASATAGAALAERRLPPGSAAPDDTRYWAAIAAQFDRPAGVVQLENGNWGAMARPVLAAYQRKTAMVNGATSFYSRRSFAADFARLRARAAGMLGVSPDEIVFTRGATEALQTLIGGYNRLRPGDGLLYADLDYDSMQAAFRTVAARNQARLVTIALPEPATHQGLIDAYTQALEANPHVRLMLLTHVSHRTGLVLPVREIVAMARTRNVDVIVDSAHAWGQLDFALPDLDADFVGLTCQKWIGAPMGVGIAYVRRNRLDAISRNMSEDAPDPDTLTRRVHTGTANFAAFLAVEDAFNYHQAIGAKAKEARLRYLRDRWAEPLRRHGGIDILTPSDPRLTCALTSFRLAGRTTVADNRAIAARMLEQHRIFVVDREGPARGACVRVTPAIFTSEDDIDRLSAALRQMSRA